MHPAANLFLVPAAGAAIGFVVAGEVGVFLGLFGGVAVGVLLSRASTKRDRRVAALEERVAALEDERADE